MWNQESQKEVSKDTGWFLEPNEVAGEGGWEGTVCTVGVFVETFEMIRGVLILRFGCRGEPWLS